MFIACKGTLFYSDMQYLAQKVMLTPHTSCIGDY